MMSRPRERRCKSFIVLLYFVSSPAHAPAGGGSGICNTAGNQIIAILYIVVNSVRESRFPVIVRN